MSESMLAVRWHARDDIRLERIPLPRAPLQGELILRVAAAGICGTDIEEWKHGPVNVAISEHPLTLRQAPLTLGHEFCGWVVDAGEGTTASVGTLVAVEVNLSCGECERCRAGQTQLCDRLGSLGLHGDGGLAEFVVVPERICVPVPANIAPLRAVLAEPLAVAVRAVRLSGVARGSRVLVVGGGAVGQLTARVALSAGADVVLVEPLESRRRVAETAGVAAIAPDDIRADFGVVIECSGRAAAVRSALAYTRAGGTIALVGVTTDSMEVSPWDLVRGEITLVGILSHTMEDFGEAVALLANPDFTTDGIVTGVVALEDAIDGAFHALVADPAAHLKIVVSPAEIDRSMDGHGP